MRTFKIYLLSNFQVYSAVSLAELMMLCLRALHLPSSLLEVCTFAISPTLQPSLLPTTKPICFYDFFGSRYK